MDGNDKYLETFRQEADELLGEIEAVILLIEENPEDDGAINRLFRAVHTLKGSGSMFGLTDIANFSHVLESALDKVRAKQLSVTRELIDLTLAYRDQVGLMLHAAEGGPAFDTALVEDIKLRLKAILPPVDKPAETPPPAPSSTAASAGRPIAYRIRFLPQPGLFATGTEPALLLDELRGLGECQVIAHFDEVPPLENADPECCYLGWDIILTTGAGRDAIRDVFIFVEDSCKIEIEDVSSDALLDLDSPRPRLGDILLQRGDITSDAVHDQLNRQSRLGQMLVESGQISNAKVASALSEQQSIAKQQAAAKSENVRVPSDKLDALINLLGELVTNQARLSQIARSSGDIVLAAPVEEADRLTDELRDIVLNIRMMPIGTTFSRFKRLVRDLSGELGKQIELEAEGAETELDKTVIDRLADPLVHLIRNSIDHGIEHPDERLAIGKPAKGTITLSAVHRGASVIISILDDGKGLDKPVILKKPRKKAWFPPKPN